MRQIRLSEAAQQDITEVLARSEEMFGPGARERYEALIAAALRGALSDDGESGSTLRPELGPGVRTWHLARSRAASRGGMVRHPRHLLLYRLDDEAMLVARVLHDSMDLPRHVDRWLENDP